METISLISPVFNGHTLRNVLQDFAPYIQKDDIFTVNSGVANPALKPEFIRNTVNQIKERYPDNLVIARTGGRRNVETLVQELDPALTPAIIYTYEPNMASVPEFSFDFARTLDNLAAGVQLAHQHGFQLWAMPTGRPILERSLLKMGWDYGQLGSVVDATVVQTQTWCRQQRFVEALEKVGQCFQRSGAGKPWYPLLALASPGGPLYNGVKEDVCMECVNAAVAQGHQRIGWQWVPREVTMALRFMELIGRSLPVGG